MNRASLLMAVLLSVFGISASAQTESKIQISVQDGALFVVDGQQYRTAASFVWPAGSKRILQFIGRSFPDESRIFTFSGWRDNQGLLSPTSDLVQTITANPQVTSLTAEVGIGYRV